MLIEWPTWWKDPQLHKLKNHHCQISVGIMKEDHLDWGSVSSAVEVLLFDSDNTNERYEEDVDEYFGDDCMFDQHDWNSSDICDLEFTWTIFIRLWLLRNIIHTITDLGQTTCLNFQKFKITAFYCKRTILLENTRLYFRDHRSWPSLLHFHFWT